MLFICIMVSIGGSLVDLHRIAADHSLMTPILNDVFPSVLHLDA